MSEVMADILGTIRTTRTSPNAVTNGRGSRQDRRKDHPVNLVPEGGKKPAAEQQAQFGACSLFRIRGLGIKGVAEPRFGG